MRMYVNDCPLAWPNMIMMTGQSSKNKNERTSVEVPDQLHLRGKNFARSITLP